MLTRKPSVLVNLGSWLFTDPTHPLLSVEANQLDVPHLTVHCLCGRHLPWSCHSLCCLSVWALGWLYEGPGRPALASIGQLWCKISWLAHVVIFMMNLLYANKYSVLWSILEPFYLSTHKWIVLLLGITFCLNKPDHVRFNRPNTCLLFTSHTVPEEVSWMNLKLC